MKPTIGGVSGLESIAGGDDGDKSASEKPLSKRQKWRLKCRAKRLRRRERKKNSTLELTGDSEDAERGQAKRTKADSAEIPTIYKAAGVAGSDGDVRSRRVKIQRSTDPRPGTVKLSGRKRKRKGVESNKEEVEFAEMVAKYRRKLQGPGTTV